MVTVGLGYSSGNPEGFYDVQVPQNLRELRAVRFSGGRQDRTGRRAVRRFFRKVPWPRALTVRMPFFHPKFLCS